MNEDQAPITSNDLQSVSSVRLDEWDCLSVEIRHHRVDTGFDENGKAFTIAEMRLEGDISDTRDGRSRSNITVRVDIEFTAEQECDEYGYEPEDEDCSDGIPVGYDVGANYSGHIQVLLPSGARTNVSMNVRLRLTLQVFPLLLAMKAARIGIVTSHDSIEHPKVNSNSYIAGYVKRCSFEPMESR